MSLYENVTRIIFIPTFRCQNHCSYCDYRWQMDEGGKGYGLEAFGNKWHFTREEHWAYWLAALSRFRPYHLSLTGGEPTLWGGLVDLIEHLPRSCSWDITSNSLEEYAVDKITPANIRTWTASYHYHSLDRFLKNIKVLRQRGFPVTVTCVLTPTNIEKIKEAIKEFNKHFIRVNIHPLLKQGFDWNEHKDVIKEMVDIVSGMNNDKLIKVITDIREHFVPDGPKDKCAAGKNYFVAFPDGRIYRCYSHALSVGAQPMAEVGDLVLSNEDEPCAGGCIFPCDVQCQRGEHLQL